MEQVIVEILQEVGVYPQIREKVKDDSELVAIIQNEKGLQGVESREAITKQSVSYG